MNYTQKLQLLYKTILTKFVSDDFIIKLSSQVIAQMQFREEVKMLSFNDILWVKTHLDAFNSKPFEFEYSFIAWETYNELLDSYTPNLDEGFKADMISNLEFLDTEISKLATVSSLDTNKIIVYLDEKYRKDLNLSFLELFPVDKEIKDQLKILKKDPGCAEIINEIFLDFYPSFTKMKINELNNGSISLDDIFTLGFLN